MKADSLNVFGEALLICGTAPITGAYRNGCCDTGPFDADYWCLCVSRWLEAYRAGVAPQIKLAATHQKTLEYVSLTVLTTFAIDDN